GRGPCERLGQGHAGAGGGADRAQAPLLTGRAGPAAPFGSRSGGHGHPPVGWTGFARVTAESVRPGLLVRAVSTATGGRRRWPRRLGLEMLRLRRRARR